MIIVNLYSFHVESINSYLDPLLLDLLDSKHEIHIIYVKLINMVDKI